MKIIKLAQNKINLSQRLFELLEDPSLQEYSCVFNAKKSLQIGDYDGAIANLKIDADKIRMANDELYSLINSHDLWKQYEQKNNRLQDILETMDVPTLRKKDYRWLSRNISVRNRQNPDINEALSLIRDLVQLISSPIDQETLNKLQKNW